MKQLALIIVVLYFFNACASIAAVSDEMREVITIEDHSLTQEEAYSQASIWFAETYNSANEVIQLKDEDSGIIVAKGAERISRGIIQYTLTYTMKVDFNDTQVKFTQTVGEPVESDIGGVTTGDAEKMHIIFETLRKDMLNSLETGEDF